jgi:hypothetical protein
VLGEARDEMEDEELDEVVVMVWFGLSVEVVKRRCGLTGSGSEKSMRFVLFLGLIVKKAVRN